MAKTKKERKENAKIDRKQIDLRHYQTEWDIIHKRISELNIRKSKTNKAKVQLFHNHLRNKIKLLGNDYKECPECILESLKDKNKKIVIRHLIDLSVYKPFKEISKKSKVPVTTIIERLIIAPLLIEK